MTPLHVCILCETSERTLLYHYEQAGQARSFVICEGCGLTSLDPLPSAQQLAKQYSQGEFTKNVPSFVAAAHKLAALSPSEKHLRVLSECRRISGSDLTDGTLVDVGCGFGELAASLAECFPSVRVVGLEPEAEVVEHLRSINKNPRIRIEQGVIETFSPAPSERVGGLFLFTVFEHLPEPLDALRRMNRLLADNGWLFVLVPDLMDPGSVFGPRSFFHTAHMYYYTDRTLGGLMKRGGFEPRATIKGNDTTFVSGRGVLVAAQKVSSMGAPATIPMEADRVRARLRGVRRRTAVAGPARHFYRYRVCRPVLRRLASLKGFVRRLVSG